MAITIVATAGASNANSFITEAEFIAYMATRLNVPTGTTVTGSDATETEKTAMIEATRELNHLAYRGTRVNATQALSWPRQYAMDVDAPMPVDVAPAGWPVYFDEDEIPTRLKNATAELAMEFIKAGTTDLAALDTQLEVKREKIDVLETEFVDPHTRARGLARFPRVMTFISGLLDAGRSGGMRLVRT